MVHTQIYGNYDVATGSNRVGQFFAIAFGHNNIHDIITSDHRTEKGALDAIWDMIDDEMNTYK